MKNMSTEAFCDQFDACKRRTEIRAYYPRHRVWLMSGITRKTTKAGNCGNEPTWLYCNKAPAARKAKKGDLE